MKNNLTLNKIKNKNSLFEFINLIKRILRLLGRILEIFNKNNFLFKTNNESHSFFFGYHDKKPFNYYDSKIIVH